MPISKWLGATVLWVLFATTGRSQQLKLGNNPYGVEKSAVLELQSTNQGLLFPRIADTALINVMTPPDGMVIYFIPTGSLLLRANGYWQALTPATSLSNYWSINGNSNGALKQVGTVDNYALPFITNNAERMRITNIGNVGIGNSAPSEVLDVTGNVKFSGALMPGNSSGTTGQLLRSNGVGVAPTWFTPAYLTSIDTGNIANFYQKVRSEFAASGPITYNDGLIGIRQASGSTNGYLSSTDWATFNNKLSSIDTGNIANFSVKVRGLFSAGSGISYNAATGVLSSTVNTANLWGYNGNTVTAEKTIGTIDNFALPFITNNIERMRITNAGKIGIGNTTPAEALDITGNLKFSGALMPAGDAGTAGYVLTSNGAGTAPTWSGVSGATGGWNLNGNNVTALKTLGTTTAYDLPFITNNTERMRLSSTGNLALGSSTFDALAPEKLLIDAGATSSYNLMYAKGSRNGYLQFNIQNLSGGGSASTDIVATSDNGTETTNYVNLGINGGGYNNANNILSGSNNGYLYSAGQNFLIGNTSPSKDLIFFTGGISSSNEQMRITANGNIGIGSNLFDGTAPEKLLIDAGNTSSYNLINAKGNINNYLQFNIQNQNNGNLASTDIVATANNGTETARFIDMGINSSGYSNTGILGGGGNAYLYSTGSDLIIGNATSTASLRFFTGGTDITNEKLRIDPAGNVGIGTTLPAYPLHVKGGGTVAAFNRTGIDGTIVSLQQDGTEEGSITVSGATVSFNAFTGSHYAWTSKPVEKGMLVTLSGENQYLHNDKNAEIIYGVQPAAQANDPKILGAFLGPKESSLPYSNTNPNLVMAVGNGVMWVADKGEDLAIGDYLVSSDVAGHAMKENGTYPTAFVVARVAEPVEWAKENAVIDGVKHKLVSVFFESFVKNNAQKELETVKQEVKDLKERIERLEKLAQQK